MQYRERRFELPHIELSAKEWGQPGGKPVIALHGWLDNAASFDVLAPQLQDVHLMALDCAGHGLSGHRRSYNLWEDVAEVFAVADQLGWKEFALMGHSRGANISTLIAGTFPERITHLVLIDGMVPPTGSPGEAPKQLARSIVEAERHRQRGFPIYPDFETAVKVRRRAELPVTEHTARLLLERGLKEVEGGYTWRNDPQLKTASAVRLSDEHLDAFVERISAPVLLALATNGLPGLQARYQKIADRYPKVRVEQLPGGHHLHMEVEPAAQLAKLINQFLSQGN